MMSIKDYKEGMVAGAKPFGDKLDQLANVSESAVSDIKEGLDGVNEVVNIVLDDLSAQEKKKIYDLDQATDISTLDDDEKEFLVAVLAELANTVENVTDLQKRYILSVCSTVGVATPQTSLNLACIENIENMRTQKVILRHVMEFFFIGSQDYVFLDNYEEILFGYFSVNKHGINDIISTINRIYNSMGIEGVANRYTFAADYQEIIDEENGEATALDSFEDEEYLNPSDYEKISINGMLSVQEEKEYFQKKVIMSAASIVNGTLTFKKCLIELVFNVSFNVSGTLNFEDCEIQCFYTGREQNNYVITSIDGGKVNFKNCIIKNGKQLLSANGDVLLEKCSIIDGDNLISARANSTMYTFKIFDSNIVAETSPDKKGCLFSVSNFDSLEIQNLKTQIPFHHTNKLQLLDGYAYSGKIENAEIECSIIYAPHISMNQCTIKKSEIDVTSISNCLISQSDITCDYNSVDKCDFSEMKNNTIRCKGVTNSTFNNIACKDQNFIKTTASISNCIFSNIDLKNGKYLIEADVDYGLGDKKQDILVSNCRFINCYTDRSDKEIIVGNQTHHTLFTDKTTPYAVPRTNCMGLNQVKGGEFNEIAIEQQDSLALKGAKIGAGIGAFIPGLGLLVGGAVGAVVGTVVDTVKETNKAMDIEVGKSDNNSINSNVKNAVEELLATHSGMGTLAKKLSTNEKTKLLAQMTANGTFSHNDIIGIYDASVMNSFSGDFNGILFLKDRIFVKLSKSSNLTTMKYEDMNDISGTLSKSIITGKNGQSITLSGINYSTEDIQQLFKKIISIVK